MQAKPVVNKKKRDPLAGKAERLRAEINTLSDSLYGLKDKDSYVRYYNLKIYRAEVLRSFVVHMHLASEDLLKAVLFDFLAKQNRSLPKKAAVRIVDEMKSAELIHWCSRLKLITPKQFKNLLELNRIRNACAHRWILDSPKIKRVGIMRKRVRTPTVTYNSKDLFDPKVFLDEFCPVYGQLYLKLLFRVWRIQGKL